MQPKRRRKPLDLFFFAIFLPLFVVVAVHILLESFKKTNFCFTSCLKSGTAHRSYSEKQNVYNKFELLYTSAGVRCLAITYHTMLLLTFSLYNI